MTALATDTTTDAQSRHEIASRFLAALAGDADGTELLELRYRRPAYALGADPASADAARILRIPGTLSHKQRPPVPVAALRLDTERRLPAAAIVGRLLDPPQARRDSAAVAGAERGDDPLLQ